MFILTVWFRSILAKHPVEQLQLKTLLEGGVGVTAQVKLRADPVR